MKQLLFFITLTIACVFLGVVQWRYARTDFSKSYNWKLFLFLSAFLCMGLIMFLFLYNEGSTAAVLIAALAGGTQAGVLFTFIVPKMVEVAKTRMKKKGNKKVKQ